MGYFFNTFDFEPGSRMTGVWQAGASLDAGADLIATAGLVQFGRDQHDELEADFLGSHLPFHFGGFHGVGPDGHPWAMMLQVSPVSAAGLVDSETRYWPMLDGLDRALGFNWEASLLSVRGFTRSDFVNIYALRDVESAAIEDWSVPDLMLGLLAECCYVPLPQIVAGRIRQCAFPDFNHDCQYDVFSDVFSVWTTGRLNPEEP
jgi:hypothetical protein